MADIGQDHIGMGREIGAVGRAGQDPDAGHAGGAPGVEIMGAVADHRDLFRLQPGLGGKGLQLPRRWFAAMAAVKSGNEIKHLQDLGLGQMRPRRHFGVIGRHPSARPRALSAARSGTSGTAGCGMISAASWLSIVSSA